MTQEESWLGPNAAELQKPITLSRKDLWEAVKCGQARVHGFVWDPDKSLDELRADFEKALEEEPVRHLTVETPQLRTTMLPCAVHSKHIPNPHQNHYHHVWPLGSGGPDIKENKVITCPTGHYNIHQLLEQFLLHRGNVPYSVLKTYAVEERKLAKLGWERITRGAM